MKQKVLFFMHGLLLPFANSGGHRQRAVGRPMGGSQCGYETCGHGFPDPAITDDIADFRKVRDDIARVIPQLLMQVG